MTEENNIRFWALCMERNACGKYKGMINVPHRPTGLSEAGKVVMWKICREMDENGPLKGKVEMPDSPEPVEEDMKENVEEGIQDGRRKTMMMDGEWYQATIHEKYDGLVDSMIAELDEATLEGERESFRADRPRTNIISNSSWKSFNSNAEEPIDDEGARASNRRSLNEGHELR